MNNVGFKLIVLELGIAILDKHSQINYFKKFENPIISNINLKNKKFGEISESLKFFKETPELLFTNNNDVADFLKNNGINAEKVPPQEEQEIQINKMDIYLKSFSHTGEIEKQDSEEKDIINYLREYALKWSSLKIQEASEQLDLHISQSVNALDELDKIINTIGTRVREWYGLHFPELDNLLQNIITYSNIVSKAGNREEITQDFLITLEMPENKIQLILDTAKRSRGGKLTDENLAILQNLAREVVSMSSIRKTLEEHLEISMQEVAPNLKEMLTAAVGARLIAKAGSLKKLASLSSSTIQILGAEKALFRTLKTGANPPKHGILFQHPVIHSAPKWQRGKLARAISSKAAIASRIDFYAQTPGSNHTLSDKLNDRIEEIQEKYKEPSQIQQKQDLYSQKQGMKFKKHRSKSFGRDEWKNRNEDRDSKFKKKKFRKRHNKGNKK